MAKVSWKPGTMVYPLPAVMVSCGNKEDGYNIITVSWTGTICTDPAMCYISIRPERHSYEMIKKQGDFVINLTTRKLAYHTDWCGVRSGADFDKFKETGLTPVDASIVRSPLIAESPLNIECKVKQILELGSHHMFISEVVAIDVNDELVDQKSDVFRLDKANMLCYSHGKYYDIGKFIGRFGFSVKRKKETKSGVNTGNKK
jgi:flavin reductase (DIM6/NTAB) family NADH-FMN oxidoreductase RutF